MSKKAIIDAKAFSEGLDQVSRALRKSSFPTLSEVCVRFEDGICILTATDLDTWLIKRIPAQGEDLAFVLNRTKDVAKACRLFDGALVLELEETETQKEKELKLLMRCSNRVAEFEAMDPELYPVYTPIAAESYFTMNAADVLARIERVSYAAMRPSINAQPSRTSVQFSGHCVFALDGARLACDTAPEFAFPRPFMASVDTLSHLKVFGKRNVQIEFGKSRGWITDGTITLDFHIPSMDIFDVKHVISQNVKELLTVSPKEFLRELKYLKELTVGERKPYVRFSGGELFMAASSGKYRTSVAVSGENRIVFGFELHKMMDAMRQFRDEDSVTLKVVSAVSPFIIEAEGRSDLALICPVRLSDERRSAA